MRGGPGDSSKERRAAKSSIVPAMDKSIEVSDAILDGIVRVLNSDSSAGYAARACRDLAEAYAWVMSPNNSHGGSIEVTTGK